MAMLQVALISGVTAHGIGHDSVLKHDSHILEPIFAFSPLQNAILAVVLRTTLTQAVLWRLPQLSAHSLAFLVASAAGGMLGNVFLHLLPEAAETQPSAFGQGAVGGFLAFAVVDKLLRIAMAVIGGSKKSVSHSHSHSQPAEPSAAAASAVAHEHIRGDVRDRSKTKQTPEKSVLEEGPKEVSQENEGETNLAAVLNTVADSLHNVADGMSLVAAFKTSPALGARAVAMMASHELPHQLGDFALVLNSGHSRGTGMLAHLMTASGTVLGCFAASSLSERVEAILAPATAGLFLYVAAVVVLPEVLEPPHTSSLAAQLKSLAVSVVGVSTGLALVVGLN